ncbi:MAG: bifunctional aldolase/short-chain dehydrogenase [Proteobacteria bacterium]|nr:bifunctional aldolase/short-chain dehydrogenase [Pseudomonadota bacterium]MBU1687533.1 bifunctional aldolase/short-chain dehydrogenase [Pseudomonadota bacterium]
MKNRYDEQEAERYVALYPDIPKDLALRVYTSKLIGIESDLVLHGGGNTSVKTIMTDILDRELPVICVKGSGWDLGDIEPPGLPALELEYLRKLRVLGAMSDEEMVNQFRTHLLEASAPTPSIETLVHAFLPHRFIDHTHADAVVTLTNQLEAEQLLIQALGDKIAVLPFIMPGFPLAKAIADLHEAQPEAEAIILMNHGIFTFGEDARTSYDRMIDYVSRAEQFIAGKMALYSSSLSSEGEPVEPDPAMILPLLRGALARVDTDRGRQHFSLEVRSTPEIKAALARPDAESLLVSGVLTPDHVIRTKNYPAFLDFTGAEDEETAGTRIRTAITLYQERYIRYFSEQLHAKQVERIRLDSMPRVILVRGLGIVAVGETPRAAGIAADIAEHTVRAKVRSAAIGSYQELDESYIFDMEYWSLEQAKLGKGRPRPLQGRVALVTGGGGAIALGIGRQLLKAGARVFMSDIDEVRLDKVCRKLQQQFSPEMISPLVMDVADPVSVRKSFAHLVATAGGLDILVPNAGVAHVATLAELDEAKFQQVIDVNLKGVFNVIKAVIPIFRRQSIGGSIVINSSKNVFDPGAAFGAYSASKAGAHQLGKIAALELAEMGVRVNMINADAIFDDEGISSGLWDVVGPDRMRSRNLDPEGLKEYYRQRNLLKAAVHADHVGNGVVFFASELTPTTGATLPVDGGIPAAFPR